MANGLFGGGEGTAESPYLIEDGQDVLKINEKLRTYPFYHFKLTNDIDMSLLDYGMIGDTNSGPPFMGVFDGNGFAVKGIRLTKETSEDTGYLGMFSIISGNQAVVKNLTIKEFFISSHDADRVAILAGNIADGATVENCYIEGTIKAREAFIGGVGVFVTKSNIRNVVVNITAEGHKAGAVVYSATDCVIENCTVLGSISGYNSYSALASLVLVVGNGTVIRNSLSKVILSNKYEGDGNHSKIAPLVDEVSETANVENSFAAISGLLYQQWRETVTYYEENIVIGSDGKFYSCYAYQPKTDPSASPVNGSAWSDFWKLAVILDTLTDEQLKDKSVFTGWDFENTWVMGANGPELKAFYTPSEEIPGGGDDTTSDIVIVTDVNFSRTKMIRDILESPIPQVWDHENNRFVPVTLQMIELMIKR